MESASGSFNQISATAKQFALRLATVGENRLELLAVEMQEARERLLCNILMALGVAVFGLLAALTFTAAIVVWLWVWSPVIVLLSLTFVYATAGLCLYRRLRTLLKNWQTLPATLDQIRKDLAGLETFLR
jgi:uncharacterized membrane protein YqjE